MTFQSYNVGENGRSNTDFKGLKVSSNAMHFKEKFSIFLNHPPPPLTHKIKKLLIRIKERKKCLEYIKNYSIHLQKNIKSVFFLNIFLTPRTASAYLISLWYCNGRWILALNALLPVLDSIHSIHSKQDNAFNGILEKTALQLTLH